MIKRTCKYCGKTENVTRIRPKTVSRAFIGVGKDGRRWYSLFCPDCKLDQNRRVSGKRARDGSPHAHVQAAVNAEKIAQKRFQDLGFDVERVSCHGPDLVCKLGEWVYKVEVKRATKTKTGWVCGWVTPKRKNDDLIAIVMPNGYVYIDDMQMHNDSCDKSGKKTITKLVKKIGLTPLPTTNPAP